MSPVLTQHVSQPITLDEQTQKMKQHLLQDIRRSAYVYRVDCGGCNACEIEIFAAITPVFDAERFGIKVVSSPRHADILLFTGSSIWGVVFTADVVKKCARPEPFSLPITLN